MSVRSCAFLDTTHPLALELKDWRKGSSGTCAECSMSVFHLGQNLWGISQFPQKSHYYRVLTFLPNNFFSLRIKFQGKRHNDCWGMLLIHIFINELLAKGVLLGKSQRNMSKSRWENRSGRRWWRPSSQLDTLWDPLLSMIPMLCLCLVTKTIL